MFATHLLLAADTPSQTVSSASSSPTIILSVAAFTVFGTFATALGPALVEIIKNRYARRAKAEEEARKAQEGAEAPVEPVPASVELVQSGYAAVGMVESAVLDYRLQRDEAIRRADAAWIKLEQVREELEEARDYIRGQAVLIARYEAEAGRTPNIPNNPGRHEMPDYHRDSNWESR